MNYIEIDGKRYRIKRENVATRISASGSLTSLDQRGRFGDDKEITVLEEIPYDSYKSEVTTPQNTNTMPSGGQTMTGKDWHDRFLIELPPAGKNEVFTDARFKLDYRDVQSAARKASGYEK